ncbi:hypothetical protein AWM70_01245 [Paenibacillus yonginensis]|uniref:Uncharacterized protein n=1 Tax=Paenibacillus yonginensis TaxID=1462996 RepID=A0A1B1MW30_9BACL|nr:hypothetical protein [Paenibacillus yonginensis]ANS73378.1 hypothetical protein AWM70_01245 [Paenibacillus yonginensis]
MLAHLLKPSMPGRGSIVIAALYEGLGEYSGIYIGDHQIITLSNKHTPVQMSIEEFSHIHSTRFKSEIYWACHLFNRQPVRFPEAAQRALHTLNNNSYKTMLINSHQFCSGCITGDFDNEDAQLSELKKRIKELYPHRHVWNKQA